MHSGYHSFRLLSVDVTNGAVHLHPEDEKHIKLLDVTSNVVLVERSSLNLSPSLAIGILDPYDPPTTTTSTTTEAPTTDITTEDNATDTTETPPVSESVILR